MKIALASPLYPRSINDGIAQLRDLVKGAAAQQAELICFPETYIPGYPLDINKTEKLSPEILKDALEQVCAIAKENSVAIILPMDWYEGENFLNAPTSISTNIYELFSSNSSRM